MKKILLVNPFPSNRYLSSILEQYNISSTALYTVDFNQVDNYLTPSPDLFSAQFFLPDATLSEIISAFKNYEFDYIINGYDQFLPLTDLLTQHFTPKFLNDPSTSKLRCNKILMQKQLAVSNIMNICQYKVNSENYTDIANKLDFPLFIKPLSSSGNIGAQKINAMSEMKMYFDKNKNLVGRLGNVLTEFILAPYIDGVEYMVDSFSFMGEHSIATIQKYNKILQNGNVRYISHELEKNEYIIDKISSYVKSVLDAVEFKNGFAHIECFYTKNSDVILIEINPRISGAHGVCHQFANFSGQNNQIEIMLNKVFGTEIQRHNFAYKFTKCVFLYNGSCNIIPDLKSMNLEKYGVNKIEQFIPPGQISSQEVKSMSDAIGVVFISADNKDDLESNAELIQQIDNLGWR